MKFVSTKHAALFKDLHKPIFSELDENLILFFFANSIVPSDPSLI